MHVVVVCCGGLVRWWRCVWGGVCGGWFGRCICVLIGECGLVCVVDGVWCML